MLGEEEGGTWKGEQSGASGGDFTAYDPRPSDNTLQSTVTHLSAPSRLSWTPTSKPQSDPDPAHPAPLSAEPNDIMDEDIKPLETVPDDIRDEEHEQMDKLEFTASLNFPGATYLLMVIAQQCTKLDQQYGQVGNARELIKNTPGLEEAFKAAWDARSLRRLRLLSES